MNKRSQFRALARAALADSALLGQAKILRSWSSAIPDADLPAMGVVTPQERIQPETLEHFQRSTLLQIVLKRIGGDELEDVLDADADAIEQCVAPALLAAGFICMPEDLSIVVNGDGQSRVGTALVNFRVQWFRTLDGRS